MKPFRWNQIKNEWLKETRGIGFEDIERALVEGNLLAIERKANPRYAHQKIFIILWNEYVYHVPYVEDEEKIFLKTIYPNRKSKKKYEKTK